MIGERCDYCGWDELSGCAHDCRKVLLAERNRLRDLLRRFGVSDLALDGSEDGSEPDLIDRHVAAYEAIRDEARRLAGDRD